MSHPRIPGIREQAVRINSIGTGLALDDLTEVVRIPMVGDYGNVVEVGEKLRAPNLDTIVIPKVESASDMYDICSPNRRKIFIP